MGKRRGRLSCWSRETFPALRGRRRMSTKLDQITEKAKSNPKLRFTSLAHLLTPEFLTEKVGNLFEADIRGYFNHIQHDWLQKMVAYRIADPLILRLIGKWLNAGFMVGGVVTRTEEGSPQGGPIS